MNRGIHSTAPKLVSWFSLMTVVLTAIGSTCCAEEHQGVRPQDGSVPKNDKIDSAQEDAADFEEVASIAGGKIRILSKTFTPPPGHRFLPYAGAPPTHVDIHDDPVVHGERIKDSETEIKIAGTFVYDTAAEFPLRGEGNLSVVITGDSGRIGGAPPVLHWAAKTRKGLVRITQMPKHDRLLCGGTTVLKALVIPDAPLTWSYVVDLGFTPNGTAASTTTKIVATYDPSAADDANLVKALAGAPIAGAYDTHVLTLTHPTYVHAGKVDDQTKKVVIGAGRRFSPSVLSYTAEYVVQDQFKRAITDSTFGGARLYHREETPLKSDYPRITKWIPTVHVGGSTWFVDFGVYHDNLDILKIPLGDFYSADGFWDVSLKGKTILSMETHNWNVSVNEKLPEQVATNHFAVVITDVTRSELTLTSTYTFQLKE